MRNTLLFFIFSSCSLFAAEHSVDTKLLCASFDTTMQDGLTSLKMISAQVKRESETLSSTQKNSSNADSRDQWHAVITTLIQYAQKQKYSLDKVTTIVNALNNESIPTGWRYIILTDKNNAKNKNRFVFGMSMNINDPHHGLTQFVVTPLQDKGKGNDLINKI